MVNLPTLQQLYASNLASIEAELTITVPLFGKNFLRALAATQAGKQWLFYKLLGSVQKNIFADTADPEVMGGTLERFGRVKLGRDPFPATTGKYTVQLSGTIGSTIPSGSTFKSNDDSLSPGFLFILDSDFVLDGIDVVTLRALSAGPESRLLVGDKLTVTAPIALVDSVCVVLTESIIPESAEDIESYRLKVLNAYRLEPQGGSGSDYRIWSSEAQGVANSYPYTASGYVNQINLFIEANLTDSIDGKGTPTPAILAAVQEAIEQPTPERPSRKPLTDFVNYLPVSIVNIDIEISSFSGGITPEIESLIFNTVFNELKNIRPFVASIDVLADRNDYFDVNKIISLILTARPGSVFGSVVLKADSIPVSSFQFENGDIPYLNSISYV